MTLILTLANPDLPGGLLAKVDTTTRKVTDLQFPQLPAHPIDAKTAFIALNAVLGTLEAKLTLEHTPS